MLVYLCFLPHFSGLVQNPMPGQTHSTVLVDIIFSKLFFSCILYHYSLQTIWCKIHHSNAPVCFSVCHTNSGFWLGNSPCKSWALPPASEGGQTGWITPWYLIYHPSLSPGLYLLPRELWSLIFRWAFVVLKLKSDCSRVLISVKKNNVENLTHAGQQETCWALGISTQLPVCRLSNLLSVLWLGTSWCEDVA